MGKGYMQRLKWEGRSDFQEGLEVKCGGRERKGKRERGEGEGKRKVGFNLLHSEIDRFTRKSNSLRRTCDTGNTMAEKEE